MTKDECIAKAREMLNDFCDALSESDCESCPYGWGSKQCNVHTELTCPDKEFTDD